MLYNQRPLIKPKALKKGSRIALIAPAGPITEERVTRTQEIVMEMGFKTCFSNALFNKKGYLAGNDNQRLEDLHAAFENPNVDAILCIRGGYGSSRIVDKIDYGLIKKNPKIFIGYSDITVLLNTIFQKTGLITFHGIVGTSSFTEYTRHSLSIITSGQSLEIEIKSEASSGIEVINQGIAGGRLCGGNLAIINSLIGTPFEIDFTSKLVFLEDVGEPPYRIDRMLTQLLLGRQLQKAAGLILGQFRGCDIDNTEITAENSLSLIEVFQDRLSQLDIPVIYGFSFGHVQHQAIFPIGINAELNTNNVSIKLLENVVE